MDGSRTLASLKLSKKNTSIIDFIPDLSGTAFQTVGKIDVSARPGVSESDTVVDSYQWYASVLGKLQNADGYTGVFTANLSIVFETTTIYNQY